MVDERCEGIGETKRKGAKSLKPVLKKMLYVFFVIAAIILLYIILIFKILYVESQSPSDLPKIEYRTDTEPLIKRFGENLDIGQCYWKVGVFGGFAVGPTSYWMKGFMMIDEDNAQCLLEKYKFENVDLNFEEGIQPEVTGCSEFEWMYNEQFSNEILGVNYMGEVYLDCTNSILYFDAERM